MEKREMKCVVCENIQKVSHSLALTRNEKGQWVSNPICPKCRRELIGEARVAGKWLPFFLIEASEAEAEKRNEKRAFSRPFLDKFARKNPVATKRNDPKLRVVSSGG